MTLDRPVDTAPPGGAATLLARRRALLAGCAVVWLAVCLLFVVQLAGSGPDDFFITYRYARNLASGQGFVYNPGERVFGLTDPGLGLLLGVAHRLVPVDVAWLANALFGACLTGLCLLLAAEARTGPALLAAVVAGTAIVVSSFLWANAGAAAAAVLLLLVWAARIAGRREALAGLLAGLAVWVRPDACVGLLALGALLAVERRRLPGRYLAVTVAVVALGLLLATLYFGQPLPNTLGAKLDMASAAQSPATHLRFWVRAALPLSRHLGSRYLLLVAPALAGMAVGWRTGGRAARVVVAQAAGIAAAYTLLGVPFFGWYLVPCVVALLLGLAFFCLHAPLLLAAPRWRVGAAVVLVAVAFWQPIDAAVAAARSRGETARAAGYRHAGEWIRRHSPPSATVAAVEIGVLGYSGERPVLDLMGLVSPWVRPFVARNDLLGALRRQPTDLVLARPGGRLDGVTASRWFRRRYHEVYRREEPGPGGQPAAVLVFARRAPP